LRHCLAIGITFGIIYFLLASAAIGEDRVTYSTGRDNLGRSKVTGTIMDYTGQHLVLRAVGGGEQPIPTSRIVEIQTTWSENKTAGDRHLAEGRYGEALTAYLDALREEPRVWAQREIMADCVRCLKELGRTEQAGEVFLQLVQSDPQTHHMGLIPLSWQAVQPAASLERKSLGWLESETTDAARLIGASWLLSTRHRARAIEVLSGLTARGDRRIACLAEAQIWRTRVATADPRELDRWAALLENMPAEVRAGPYFTWGQGLAARGQSRQAALALMRVPILYAASDRGLAAAALLSAGRELERIGDTRQAASLYREVLRDYAASPAAGQASARLDRLEAE
jgi:hypothetical protein